MALEDQFAKLIPLMEKHNSLLEQVLAASKGGSTAAASAPKADKAAGKTTAAADTSTTAAATDGPTFAETKALIVAWLMEFAKEEDAKNPEGMHPEAKARREALGSTMKALGKAQLPEFEADAEALGRLHTWLETKAKKIDRGFGIGRLVEDPAPAASGADDLGV